MWSIPDAYEAALAWLRKRVPMSAAQFNAATEAARQKAFTVASVAQLDVVTDVWQAVDRAVSDGTTLDTFKKAIGERLRTAWQGTVENPGARIETIFRTNVQLAYARGRHEQMSDPEVLAIRPYWMFDAVLDGRTTEVCRECDGKVVSANSAWWSTHTPPLHFNCRSAITTLTHEQALASGVTSRPPSIEGLDGFGSPTEDWAPNEADYPGRIWNVFQRKAG